jgi:hypothetical protein
VHIGKQLQSNEISTIGTKKGEGPENVERGSLGNISKSMHHLSNQVVKATDEKVAEFHKYFSHSPKSTIKLTSH